MTAYHPEDPRADLEIEGVAHPSHYTFGSIEVIDLLADWGFVENFCKGNAIKYIARAGRKDPAKEIQDLEKAVFYLKYLIRRKRGQRDSKPDEEGT